MAFNFKIRTERLATFNHEPDRNTVDLTTADGAQMLDVWCSRCHQTFPHDRHLNAVCPDCGWHVGS